MNLRQAVKEKEAVVIGAAGIGEESLELIKLKREKSMKEYKERRGTAYKVSGLEALDEQQKNLSDELVNLE